MSLSIVKKQAHKRLRAKRARARFRGTATCPRLSVQRSLKHIRVQLIDDDASKTLASASDTEVTQSGKPLEIAKHVGIRIGEKAQTLGIVKAVFDRGAARYHGRVAALADGAREAGLTF